MARLTIAQRDALMAKRIRWEDSLNEEKEFKRMMVEKLKRDLEDPKTVGSFGKKAKKKDPFEGMHFVGVFGLPLARYAYDAAEEPKKKKESKHNDDTLYI
jgi:hypothetical protein